MGRKQHYGYLKWQPAKFAHEKICIWLRKGNFKKENESILIAVENNAIGKKYGKEKIGDTQSE